MVGARRDHGWIGGGCGFAGLFAVRDALKPNAANACEQLQRHGMRIYLVTGDNPRTAAHAGQLGIASGQCFCRSSTGAEGGIREKTSSPRRTRGIRRRRHQRRAALAQADLGIAVSRASDIAREAADIILLKSKIEAVPEALGLGGRRCGRSNKTCSGRSSTMRSACRWRRAFISPIFCAAAMGFSDLIVIGNALRLLRWKSTNKL